MSTLSLPVKALFIDEPFMEDDSLRARRSRFLWKVVAANTDADLLLLKSDKYLEQAVPQHYDYDRLYSLSLDGQHQILPSGYHQLAKGQGKRFTGILDSKRYQLIVMAGLKCLPLCYLATRTLPHSVVVVDLERLYLPEMMQRWKRKPDLQNIGQLWDLLRQKLLDKYLLKNTLKYLVADPQYPQLLKPGSILSESDYLYLPLPFAELETMPDIDHSQAPTARYILFWGDSEHLPNLNAAKTIARDIYPRISKELVEKNISIMLCGGDSYQSYCGGRIIYAPAAELETWLPDALFVLLPLSEPDSESRVYRCAQHQKALLCTPQFLSSLPLPEGTYYSGKNPDSIAAAIHHMLRAPKELEKTGSKLYEHCRLSYAADTLSDKLLETLKKWMETDINE